MFNSLGNLASNGPRRILLLAGLFVLVAIFYGGPGGRNAVRWPIQLRGSWL